VSGQVSARMLLFSFLWFCWHSVDLCVEPHSPKTARAHFTEKKNGYSIRNFKTSI
jgi:hypothetical protein